MPCGKGSMSNFSTCLARVKSKEGYSDESAHKVCGKIKSDIGKASALMTVLGHQRKQPGTKPTPEGERAVIPPQRKFKKADPPFHEPTEGMSDKEAKEFRAKSPQDQLRHFFNRPPVKKAVTAGTSSMTGSNMMHTTADGMKKGEPGAKRGKYNTYPHPDTERRIPEKEPRVTGVNEDTHRIRRQPFQFGKSFSNTAKEKVRKLPKKQDIAKDFQHHRGIRTGLQQTRDTVGPRTKQKPGDTAFEIRQNTRRNRVLKKALPILKALNSIVKAYTRPGRMMQTHHIIHRTPRSKRLQGKYPGATDQQIGDTIEHYAGTRRG